MAKKKLSKKFIEEAIREKLEREKSMAPVFPDDFTHWNNGLNVDDVRINEWIREGRKFVSDPDNADNTVWYCSTGNSICIVFQSGMVIVSKDYHEFCAEDM